MGMHILHACAGILYLKASNITCTLDNRFACVCKCVRHEFAGWDDCRVIPNLPLLQGTLPQACQIDSSWGPLKKLNARKLEWHVDTAEFPATQRHKSIEYAWHLLTYGFSIPGPGSMLVLPISQVMPKVLRHTGHRYGEGIRGLRITTF